MAVVEGFKIELLLNAVYDRLKLEGQEQIFERFKCGSLSALAILEFFKKTVNIEQFINDINDGNKEQTGKLEDGSTILDLTFALLKTNLVDVELYLAEDNSEPISEVERIQVAQDNRLLSKIKSFGKDIVKPAIALEEIIAKTNKNSIPIFGFHKNGQKELAHFSPFRGLNGEILLFPLKMEFDGDCNVMIDDFKKNWWTLERERFGVLFINRKLNEWDLLNKIDEYLSIENEICFEIVGGFRGDHWSGALKDNEGKIYTIDDSERDALWELLVNRGWIYELRNELLARYICVSKQQGKKQH